MKKVLIPQNLFKVTKKNEIVPTMYNILKDDIFSDKDTTYVLDVKSNSSAFKEPLMFKEFKPLFRTIPTIKSALEINCDTSFLSNGTDLSGLQDNDLTINCPNHKIDYFIYGDRENISPHPKKLTLNCKKLFLLYQYKKTQEFCSSCEEASIEFRHCHNLKNVELKKLKKFIVLDTKSPQTLWFPANFKEHIKVTLPLDCEIYRKENQKLFNFEYLFKQLNFKNYKVNPDKTFTITAKDLETALNTKMLEDLLPNFKI